MKIWFKMYTGSKLLKDLTVEDLSQDTRTHKILNALESACRDWDLEKPYWLKKNEQEFLSKAKTRFTKDNFIEEIQFDFLEMSVLEEDFMVY